MQKGVGDVLFSLFVFLKKKIITGCGLELGGATQAWSWHWTVEDLCPGVSLGLGRALGIQTLEVQGDRQLVFLMCAGLGVAEAG